MRFSIDPSIFILLPTLRVGLVVVTGADATTAKPEIAALLREAEATVRSSLQEETFKEHASIACWQNAHRAFRSNPNKFPPSLQALVKRVLKGGELPSINPLVDLYNVASLKFLLPEGGEDLAAVQGNIRLTIADGSESFVELGASENEPPEPGECIYRDDTGAICRKLNWREADRTKLTEATRDCVLVLESLSTDDTLEQALVALAASVTTWTGASTATSVLGTNSNSADL